jgi:hypothetical protein
MTTKQPNEIEINAERMKEAWNAQRDLPKSENRLPRFDPNTDKTDWVVSAFYISAAETAEPKKAKAKKAKGATAEPVEAKA